MSLRARYLDALWDEPDGAQLKVELSGKVIEAGDGTVFASPKSIALYWDVLQAVDVYDRHILVVGERGTGKESIAQLVAEQAGSRVVAVNCATLAESIADAQLFGIAANSGIANVPRSGVDGLIDEANGAVLFLDEFFDAASSVLPKLLRLLQQREWHRVGETEPRRLKEETFIVAATNRVTTRAALYLIEDALDARVRPDIVDRFDLAIEVPPLRERREEIPALARSLLNSAWEEKASRRSEASPTSPTLAEEGATALRDANYEWPGNIRELRRLVREQLRLQWAEVLRDQRLTIPPTALATLRSAAQPEAQRPAEVESKKTDNLPAWNDPAWSRKQRTDQLVAALRVEMLREGLHRVDASWVSGQFQALVGGVNAHQALKTRIGLKASEVADLVSGLARD